MPAKQYADYGGAVPPETCEYFCSRFIDCAKSGMFFAVAHGALASIGEGGAE